MELDCSFKFVMVDDSGTGKTNFFVSLYISDKFTLDSKNIQFICKIINQKSLIFLTNSEFFKGVCAFLTHFYILINYC